MTASGPRPTLSLKPRSDDAPAKDAGRKALRPAGRKQASDKHATPKPTARPERDPRSEWPGRDARPSRPGRASGASSPGRFDRPERTGRTERLERSEQRPAAGKDWAAFAGRSERGERPARSEPRRDSGFKPRRDHDHDRTRPPHAALKTDFPAASLQSLRLFLPCPAGVQDYLAAEVARICPKAQVLEVSRGGVAVQADGTAMMQLNLHSRLALRVLVELHSQSYRQENDLYHAALALPWESWFGLYQSFRVDVSAQASPLKSLNFAALKVKDAIADRFRQVSGARPNVDTHRPDARIHLHLNREQAVFYIDSTGEPLFKRGWRQDKGEAPLKETLAAAMLAASAWDAQTPLYDPCCGSGTIAIEAAQIAANIAPGGQRHFAFERLKPFEASAWAQLKASARQQERPAPAAPVVFGSDVAHRMVDFAQRNAQRAGVAAWLEFRGGDALQRKPPCNTPGLIMLNPPYGERIDTGGFSAASLDFFSRLATHWKQHFDAWTAWVLSPDFKLPGQMHLQESRKIPLWNGAIECRLFRFEIQGKQN